LSFELEIRDEDHASQDRAGFSVILLGEDLLGIELGFWEDRIWAQSGPTFQQAEGVDFTTNGGENLYELWIQGLEYALLANGSEILSGATRDYSSASPTVDPYDTPNMLFLGDDTGSASADFTLGRITLDAGPFGVPLPATWILLLVGLGHGYRLRQRRSGK
jgi:hypothetical protein